MPGEKPIKVKVCMESTMMYCSFIEYYMYNIRPYIGRIYSAEKIQKVQSPTIACEVKGLSVIGNSKLHFFPNHQFFSLFLCFCLFCFVFA